MTVNPHRGKVEIALRPPGGGCGTFILRPTWQALAEIEERTGRGLYALARSFLEDDFAFRDVAAVIAAGLKAAGGPSGPEEVAELVFRTGVRARCGPAAALLARALGGDGEDGPGEAPAAEGTRTDWPSAAISEWRSASSAGRRPSSGPPRPVASPPRPPRRLGAEGPEWKPAVIDGDKPGEG